MKRMVLGVIALVGLGTVSFLVLVPVYPTTVYPSCPPMTFPDPRCIRGHTTNRLRSFGSSLVRFTAGVLGTNWLIVACPAVFDQ